MTDDLLNRMETEELEHKLGHFKTQLLFYEQQAETYKGYIAEIQAELERRAYLATQQEQPR